MAGQLEGVNDVQDCEQDIDLSSAKQSSPSVRRHLVRGLRARNLLLVSIAGSIGASLFVGIGIPLSQGGPLSLLLGFLVFGLTVLLPTQYAVAEMCTLLPMESTIFHFATRFVDPAVGFAMGWNYWYGGAIVVALEATAAGSLIRFWTDINSGVWITMVLVTNLILNIYTVRWYGETESVFASFKILLILSLILMTVITCLGANPIHDRYGFRTWVTPGAVLPYILKGAAGNFCGWLRCFIYAGLVMGGPDVLAMQAGEVEDPRRNIPRAAKKVMHRLLFFYLGGALCVGLICSTDDPAFKEAMKEGKSGAAGSPWVIGMKRLHITGLTHVINALILTSVWSGGNAALYTGSRTLYALALDGKAPKCFKYCTTRGIPIYCVLAVNAVGCLSYLSVSNSAITVFSWLADLATVAWLITFTGINFTYLRFYAGIKAQEGLISSGVSRSQLLYRGPFQPYWSWIGVVFGCLVILLNGFDIFLPQQFTVRGLITCYFSVVFSLLLFVSYKAVKRTKVVNPEMMDIFGDEKLQFDREDEEIWIKHRRKSGAIDRFFDRWL